MTMDGSRKRGPLEIPANNQASFLLGIPTPESKRRRVEIDESLRVLRVDSSLPPMPKSTDHFQTAMQLVHCIVNYHTTLSPITSQGARHPRGAMINPFQHTEQGLAALGIQPVITHSSFDTPIATGSTLTYSHVNGCLPRLMLMNTIIETACIRPVYDDPEAPLRCAFCEVSSAQTTSLFTVVEEYQTTCCHPLLSDLVSWATPHPFKSSRMPGTPHRRQGGAICAKCLYNQVIVKDTQILTLTGNWFTFSKMIMDNYDEVSDTRRFCSCSVDDGRSVICLYNFSIITHLPGMVDDSLILRLLGDDPTLEERANTEGFATLDPPDTTHLKDMFKIAMHPRYANETYPEMLKYDKAKTAKDIENIYGNLQYINDKVSTLDTTLRDTLAQCIPAPAPFAVMRDPVEALKYVTTFQPMLKTYHQALQTLNKEYADKIIFTHETPQQSTSLCDTCGGVGHTATKLCPLMTDLTMKTRGGASLSEHMAGNIEKFFETQREGLIDMTNLHMWQNERLVGLYQELNQRMAKNLPYARHGPSRHYLSKQVPAGRTIKKVASITPSMPFFQLAPLVVEDVEDRVAIELFMNIDALKSIKEAWEARGVDTSDFQYYYDWIEYAMNNGLDRTTIDNKTKIRELINYARFRLNGQGEISLPVVPTSAAPASSQVNEPDHSLNPVILTTAQTSASAFVTDAQEEDFGMQF